MEFENYMVDGSKKIILSEFPTKIEHDLLNKKNGKKLLKENIKKMSKLQDLFYAYDKYSLLLIFQAMDAAGKDSAIKHVMSGVNPQGTQVFSFKKPSKEELEHDYLWRTTKALPERGRIGIFNRSYYEEVLVVRVHNLVKYQNIPDEFVNENIWSERFEQIKNFENHIYRNGTIILKFFLNVSKEEQKNRFLKRLNTSSKNWKFNEGDLEERKLWKNYMKSYEDAINNTSTHFAPWYVLPADNKWYTRLLISDIIVNKLSSLNMNYPSLSSEQLKNISFYKQQLENE